MKFQHYEIVRTEREFWKISGDWVEQGEGEETVIGEFSIDDFEECQKAFRKIDPEPQKLDFGGFHKTTVCYSILLIDISTGEEKRRKIKSKFRLPSGRVQNRKVPQNLTQEGKTKHFFKQLKEPKVYLISRKDGSHKRLEIAINRERAWIGYGFDEEEASDIPYSQIQGRYSIFDLGPYKNHRIGA